MCTSILELPCLPHALFDLTNLFLVNKEEAGHLSESHDFCGKRQIMDVLQCIVEAHFFVRADLETPQIIMCVPWSFPQVMIRESVQWSPILAPIPWDNADDMGVRTHDNSGILCCHETTARGLTRLEFVVLGVELCIAR